MISILIPSRGRFDALVSSVRSFVDTAVSEDFEILIKLDAGDNESLNRMMELNEFRKNVRVVTGPRLRGYFDLHKFYNCLAALSSGQWLWLFNDDSRVVTPGWDAVFQEFGNPAKPQFVWPHVEWDYPDGVPNRDKMLATYSKSKHYDFPAISRGAYDAMGHFSMSCLNDVYIFDVAAPFKAACHETDKIVVSHAYARDDTHPHDLPVNDALRDHQSPEVQRHIALDIQRLSVLQ